MFVVTVRVVGHDGGQLIELEVEERIYLLFLSPLDVCPEKLRCCGDLPLPPLEKSQKREPMAFDY